MKNPLAIYPGDDVRRLGAMFGTPLLVKGYTWLPVTQVLTWLGLLWHFGRIHPERSGSQRAGLAAVFSVVLLGSEWCHNLAHAAAARLIGKPMDALRVAWGMPLCVYYNIDDLSVTPRQHIVRALGGPLINLFLLLPALLVRGYLRRGTPAREVADVAVSTNVFLCSVSLLPLPMIDGGPLLKWALVERGRTPRQADETVRKVNGALSIPLALGGWLAARQCRLGLAAFLSMMALTALGFARGWIQER